MNKEKFLSILKKKLSILEESEIEENLEEYSNFIDEKVKKGASEEEAVKALGDPEVLAKEILSAYKVKTDNNDTHDMINNLVNKVMSIFDSIINVFAKKGPNEIIKFVIEIVMIFIVIAICKLPFYIIEEMGENVFASFSPSIFRAINSIWNFVLELAYLLFAVLLFIKIFENRFKDEIIDSKENVSNNEKKESKKEKTTKNKTNISEKRKDDKVEINHTGFGDFLTKICIWFIKFIFLMCLMGVSFYLVGMAFCVGISIYLLFRGVFYIGAYLIIYSLFALGIVAFIILFNYIFDHKNKLGVLLIISIVSIITLGVGTGICAIEFASSTIEYKENTDYNKQVEFTYQMTDDLVIVNNILREDNIVIDEAMEDNIKIVYNYNDEYIKAILKPEINYYKNYKVLHIGYDVTSFKYNHNYLDKFIDNLKDRKVVLENPDSFDVQIYLSSKTLDKLRSNEKKYYNYYDEDNELEDICEDLRDYGYELPNYCNKYIDERV